MEAFQTSTNTESEAYIGLLALCAPESFYDNGDFLPSSIQTDICYL